MVRNRWKINKPININKPLHYYLYLSSVTLRVQQVICCIFKIHIFFFNFPSSLIDVLRNEARVMEGLHSLGIEGLSLHNVLKLNIQPSDSDYAVDIRSPAISVRVVFIKKISYLPLSGAFLRCQGNFCSYLDCSEEKKTVWITNVVF